MPAERAPEGDGRQLRSLAAMAHALARSAPLAQLVETAAEEALRVLGAVSVSVSRVVPGTDTVQTMINVGLLGPAEERWPQDETYSVTDFPALGGVLEGLRTWRHLIDDPDCPEAERRLMAELGKGAAMGAPLVVDGAFWGELYATRLLGEPGFGDLDAAYVEALLAILSGALSRALREEALERLAFRDAMTGLANRRALEDRVASLFGPGRRSDDLVAGPPAERRTVTAVAVDINGLKQVNDTLGHPVGDQLISAVALDLRRVFRDLGDALVARVGGDEFLALASDVAEDDLVAAADEVCRLARGPLSGVAATRLGVSAGVATRPWRAGGPEAAAELFAAADRALYVAKRGKRAVTVRESELGPVVVPVGGEAGGRAC